MRSVPVGRDANEVYRLTEDEVAKLLAALKRQSGLADRAAMSPEPFKDIW